MYFRMIRSGSIGRVFDSAAEELEFDSLKLTQIQTDGNQL